MAGGNTRAWGNLFPDANAAREAAQAHEQHVDQLEREMPDPYAPQQLGTTAIEGEGIQEFPETGIEAAEIQPENLELK
jgi:hypothetical protein